VQKQVVQLLQQLQERHGLTYLFISHDLAVVRALAHDVIVVKDGQMVEHGPTERLFSDPRHPYTQELLQAALV
jgi:microcin C transport system ATP-binding protein